MPTEAHTTEHSFHRLFHNKLRFPALRSGPTAVPGNHRQNHILVDMRIAMLWILLFSLSGCADSWRMENGPLTASSPGGSSELRFTPVLIDLGKGTDARVLAGQIKLARDAPLLPIGALRPEFVARYLPPYEDPPQVPESYRERRRGYDSYEGGGIFVRFRNGSLVLVSLYTQNRGERFAPQLAAPGSSVLFTLPLSDAEMAVVFGPPRRVYREIFSGP
jgi:hypothetical protein